MRNPTRALALVLLALTGCGDRAAAPAANTQVVGGDAVPGTLPDGKFDGADAILARAQQWVDEGVMYSWSPNWNGYRTDCSGLVSWAWGLPPPGHTTYSFAGGPWDDGVSYEIGWDELEPGDALNYAGSPSAGTGHTMIFAGWTDGSQTAFVSIEEYNFGHAAEVVVHGLWDSWTGAPIRQQYLPMRSVTRDPPIPIPDPEPEPQPDQVGTGWASGHVIDGWNRGPLGPEVTVYVAGRATRVGEDGTWLIEGIAGGDHGITAVDDLGRYETWSGMIHVEEGQGTEMDLELVPL